MINEFLNQLAFREIKAINKSLATDKYDDNNRVVGMSWNMSYREMVSNSHCAPRGGETNWGGRKENAPRGYPGFEGRLWIRYLNGHDTFASEPFRKSILHTGTGGGGSYSGPWTKLSEQLFKNRGRNEYDRYLHIFSWDCRFFLDDVPKIRDMLEKEIIWRALNGVHDKRVSHEFNWEDPEVMERDRGLLLGETV